MEQDIPGLIPAERDDFETGPFSLIGPAELGVSQILDADGGTIAIFTGTQSEIGVFNLFERLNFDYEPVPVETFSEAVRQFRDGAADFLLYPTELIDEALLPAEFLLLTPSFNSDGSDFQQGANMPQVGSDTVDDLLTGDSASNELLGLGGNDTLEGGADSDTLDGGTGQDTAIFSGSQSTYTLSLSIDQVSLTDRRINGDGMDRLLNIEFLDFASELPIFGNGPMNLDAFDDSARLNSEQFAAITELYIAYFNRAPDAIGLNFWASSFARGEVDLAGMAELFFDQAETRAAYAASLNEDGSQITDVNAFVTAIFTNVLGRAPDAGGRDFWVGVLERGEVTPGSAIGSIIEGAKADAPSDATQAEIEARTLDQQYLSNATDIGVHFAVINGMSDTANADAVMDRLTRSSDSVSNAVAQSNQFLADAQAATGGEFLMPLVGVVDDPFTV